MLGDSDSVLEFYRLQPCHRVVFLYKKIYSTPQHHHYFIDRWWACWTQRRYKCSILADRNTPHQTVQWICYPTSIRQAVRRATWEVLKTAREVLTTESRFSWQDLKYTKNGVWTLTKPDLAIIRRWRSVYNCILWMRANGAKHVQYIWRSNRSRRTSKKKIYQGFRLSCRFPYFVFCS